MGTLILSSFLSLYFLSTYTGPHKHRPGYCPPEIIRGESYGPSADIYSLAIVMTEVVTLRAAYSDSIGSDGRNRIMWREINERIVKDDLRPTMPADDSDLYRLIRSMWHPLPSSRPSSKTVNKRLRDMSEAFKVTEWGEMGRDSALKLSKSIRLQLFQDERDVASFTASSMDRDLLGSFKSRSKGRTRLVSTQGGAADAMFNELMGRTRGEKLIARARSLMRQPCTWAGCRFVADATFLQTDILMPTSGTYVSFVGDCVLTRTARGARQTLEVPYLSRLRLRCR